MSWRDISSLASLSDTPIPTTPRVSTFRRLTWLAGLRQRPLAPSSMSIRIAESCGALGIGNVDRILRNLRFDLSQRKVLLVFDEAQHLSIECLETIRELLDQPPHCGLPFAGTHELEKFSPAKPWNWSNGVPAFMPARGCLASPKTRPPRSCTLSWESDSHYQRLKG